MKNHVLNCHEKNDAIWAVSFCRFKNTSMIILKVGGTFIILKIKTNDSFATEKDSVKIVLNLNQTIVFYKILDDY